ncbi:MAG TPA: transcriptional regulator [Tepidisphaeraceae bacterium]
MTFDPLVANPGRLRILAALAEEPAQAFVQLRSRTGLTDGNLATHARRLESAGLVMIEKQLHEGKPVTTLHLTREGREALASHVRSLVEVLDFKRQVQAETPAPAHVPVEVAADHDEDWVD